MVFLLHVGRLPLAIGRIVSRNQILCEAALVSLRSKAYNPCRECDGLHLIVAFCA